MARFKINNLDEKTLDLSPDIIHVLKNNTVMFTLKEIKVTRMFGKTLLEGVNTIDSRSPIVIDLSKIRQMWSDSYSRQCDIWHIEL